MIGLFDTTNIGGCRGHARRAALGLLFGPFVLLGGLTAAQTHQIVETSKPAFEGPRLSIPVKEKEFGVVTRGESIEATFELKNVGTEPLKILHVKPG